MDMFASVVYFKSKEEQQAYESALDELAGFTEMSQNEVAVALVLEAAGELASNASYRCAKATGDRDLAAWRGRHFK